MEPALIVAMMVLGRISVALAMLWGMLRIARRHQPRQTPRPLRPAASPDSPAPLPLRSWQASLVSRRFEINP